MVIDEKGLVQKESFWLTVHPFVALQCVNLLLCYYAFDDVQNEIAKVRTLIFGIRFSGGR